MEAHLCNHPKVPHTVEYILNSQKADGGASVVCPFDDLEDADQFAQKIIRQNPGRLVRLKVFRSDNPVYACFVWDNPKRGSDMAENQKVKLEVDMDPLKEAFENVAIGFKEQGTSIRNLYIVQGLIVLGLAGSNIAVWMIK